ncbi:MAG: hypothetical protein DMG53_11005 [Acidobacteria bacterium]|nr:MAG: hypothetical protein DMG53_11005 [Acidobacteriota bacterium]PYU77343.1 MAG: hypothetical protein DMG52_00740 [Acidobacteriota bacterium]
MPISLLVPKASLFAPALWEALNGMAQLSILSATCLLSEPWIGAPRFTYAAETVRYIPGKLYMGGITRLSDTGHGWITAIDGSSGKIRWRYRSLRPVAAAVTTTSGNVVFSGELTGDFIVLDAQSGEVLYRFNAGGPIGAGIITYQIDGTHYVSVMSGRPSGFWVDKNPSTPTVFLFALP